MKLSTRILISIAGMGLAAGMSCPAAAKVAAVSSNGFIVRHLVEVPASIDESWAMLLKPSEWWDSDHTWSGDAANLSIDPRAGGCFCEVLPNKASPHAAPRGGVEHMHVVYIERPRALRMVGALGPLQADAANGTLTIQLKPAPDGKGTQILLEYVVGGYIRTSYETMAKSVDSMLGEQIDHLTVKLGGAFAKAFPVPDEEPEAKAGPDSSTDVLPLPEAPPKTDGNEIIGR